MKTVHVAAAVICDTFKEKQRVFATARGYGQFAGSWEFPGGKIEPGESSADALIREIKEELGCTIKVGPLAGKVEYDYPNFHLSMECFWCEVAKGEIKLFEATEGRWLSSDELYDVDWLPADIKLIGKLVNQMQESSTA